MNASHLGEQKKEEKKAMRHAMAQSKNVRRHEAPGTSRLLRAKMFGDKKIRAQAHLECRRAKTFGDKLLTGASPMVRS